MLSLQDLSFLWQQQYCQPEIPLTSLSILHYNIRLFHSNQANLVEIVNTISPTIISLNELGTVVPTKTFKQLLFSYYVYVKEGTNSHGGVVLAINKKLKCQPISMNEPSIMAVCVIIEDHLFIVGSIYSPPTESLPLTTMTTLLNESRNLILAGDFNAKHMDWKCPQVNTKGRLLSTRLNKNNLNVLNSRTKASLRSDTAIDLIISGEIPETSESQCLPYAGSDCLPILTKFFNLNISMDKHFVPRTYWKLYSSILSILYDQLQAEQEILQMISNNSFPWFLMFEQFLAALKLGVTIWKEVKRKRPSISPSI
ncbi:unnamed protein product [Rotaria socialis]|uniref:Endonuclease/exonuclease/phosphatase domain-containing protein n=2 Tax=Rotaria socialis TaxID=392032 RepID=A0A818NGM2_9BILA|nr:unnamed protein product [Rotaria socialis]